MALSKRERYIALGVAAAVGLFGLDRFVLTPYQARKAELATQTAAVSDQINKASDLISRQRRMRPIWAKMTDDGQLKTNVEEARTQAMVDLQKWVLEAGLSVTGLKAEKTTPDGRWVQASVHISGTGPMAAIGRLLWKVEKATIPLRVNDIQLTPAKEEGQDNLTIQMNVSTLCLLPETDKDTKPKPGGPARPGGGGATASAAAAAAIDPRDRP